MTEQNMKNLDTKIKIITRLHEEEQELIQTMKPLVVSFMGEKDTNALKHTFVYFDDQKVVRQEVHISSKDLLCQLSLTRVYFVEENGVSLEVSVEIRWADQTQHLIYKDICCYPKTTVKDLCGYIAGILAGARAIHNR